MPGRVSRRTVLVAGAAGGAAIVVGGVGALRWRRAGDDSDEPSVRAAAWQRLFPEPESAAVVGDALLAAEPDGPVRTAGYLPEGFVPDDVRDAEIWLGRATRADLGAAAAGAFRRDCLLGQVVVLGNWEVPRSTAELCALLVLDG